MGAKKGISIRLTGDDETVKQIAEALNLKVYGNDYGGGRVYFKAEPDNDAVDAICDALRIANVLDQAEEYREGRRAKNEARTKSSPTKRLKV